MTEVSKEIQVRNFSGSAVPLGSMMGKILINSEDGKKVANSIRKAIKGKASNMKLSPSTKKALITAGK